MKIAILSMQRINNYGSLLQSYSLMKLLKQFGHDVYFLDIECRAKDNALLDNNMQMRFAEGETATRHIFPKLQKIDRYIINRIKHKIAHKKRIPIFEEFRTDNLEMNKTSRDFDLCIIGSDEVFNCLTPSKWGFTSQLFGNIDNVGHVITYAASCGSTTYDNVPVAVKKVIANSLSRLDGISVRDENTMNFVRSLTQNNALKHADPVIIGDFTQELSVTALPNDLPERYCIIYSYHNRFNAPEEIREILDFCKRHKMIPVAIGAPQKWIKKYWCGSPFTTLKVFQNAAFVITDTFHGAIFSAKYAQKFAVVSRESNRNKLLDLLITLGIEKHHLKQINMLEEIYCKDNDIDAINVKASELRSQAISYLREFI